MDADLKSTSTNLYAAREQVTYYKAENKNLHDEMAVINQVSSTFELPSMKWKYSCAHFHSQLFSQLLAGFNGGDNIDIDKLTHVLEENRDLLSDMTNRECSQEGAAQLPKILFDLVSQANDSVINDPSPDPDTPSTSAAAAVAAATTPKVTSAQEIMNNLPKVWKVLIELLNHQKMTPVPFKVSFRFFFPWCGPIEWHFRFR